MRKVPLHRARSRRLSAIRVAIGVGLVGGLTAAAGIAYASIPDSGGVFHGCVNKATGVLRVIDTAKTGALGSCIASGPLAETAISWNQTGPKGPQGPAGPQGAPGITTNCVGYPHADIDWHGCDLHGAVLGDASLQGAGMNLSGANLSGANMEDIWANGVNLRNANLSAADLSSPGGLGQ